MGSALKNKKGIMGIIIFFVILFTILIIGFVAAIVLGVLDIGSDTITPVMKDLGMVENANLSEAGTYTFGVIDSFLGALPWLLALAYGGALVFSMIFAFSYNNNPNPAFIGVYLALILLLIVGSIIISNAYQDIYEGGDDLGTRLQENSALSYMILYSPFILALIAFITGAYIFSRAGQEGQI